MARHARQDLTDGDKRVWWEQPDGTKGLGGRKVQNLPLYGLPELLAAPYGSTVIVCEGEKAAEALRQRGICAVGTVTGAHTIPSDKVLLPLLDYGIVLWPDNDEAGRGHMERIAERLKKLDQDCVVCELRCPSAPDKDDAHDFFEGGGDPEEVSELIVNLPIDGQSPIDGQHLRLAIYEEDGHLWNDAEIIRLSDVKPEPVRWLWPGLIPLGKLSVLDGDPGLGKSLVTIDLAARVSMSVPMPDESKGDLDGPAGVVLITAEDALADTVRPRLEAAGADASRIVALQAVGSGDDRRMPDLTDLGAIEAAIQRVDAKLAMIDPLMAFLPSATDSHRDQDVRRILAPLARLAEEAGVAILVVRHLNKNTAVPSLYRGGGSIGIIGAVRSAMLVAKDPDDETGHRRVIAMQKQNLAAPSPSLAFRVVSDDYNVPYIVWEGETSHTAESLLATRRERSGSKLGQAAVFLSDLLADGRVPMTEVIMKAAAAGISPKTLRAAKHDLEICSQRVGFGPGSKVFWSLTPVRDGEDKQPEI